jgi:glycosyltransferase involved in cell wall biosynthesis
MAAGRATVFVGPEHCEPADTIRLAGAGVTIAPGDVDGLVAALTLLADDPSLARRMGERGRSAFLAAYERKLCCDRWLELIGELMGTQEAPRRLARAPFGRSVPDREASARFEAAAR